MSLIAAIIGRLLLAFMFVISGIQKLADQPGTNAMLLNAHLPGNMAMAVGIFEIVAGLLLAIGLMTRLVSLLLVVFVAGGIFFLHNQFGDPNQQLLALKDVAIIGGLLMTFAYGQMRGSYDWMRERRRTHEAELRAARAEGRAEGATEVPRTVVNPAPATVVNPAPAAVVTDDGRVVEERPRRRWFW